MANSTVTIGSAVEVSSDEPEYRGAWYVATVVDEAKASPTKSRNVKKTGYLVKYHSVTKEDDASEPFTEVVDSSFIRPVPPRNVRRNSDGNVKEAEVVVEEEGDGGGDFEVYDVIDAFHKAGWYIGVVKGVIVEGEMRKYIVSFENSPGEFEFERGDLRFHVDWIDRRWMIPPKKTPEQELCVSNATPEHDAHSGVTTPSKRARVTDVDDLRGKRFQSSAGSSGVGLPDHHGKSLNQAGAGSTMDYQQDCPFIKLSPVWATIEFYSQKPHFAPLKKMKEQYREGLAIAQMVTYGNLVHRLPSLKPSDSFDTINDSLETLLHLETHGFNVGGLIRRHIYMLLSLKSNEEELEGIDKELQKCNHEKSLLKRKMDELKGKTQQLNLKSLQIATRQKAKKQEVSRLRRLVSNQVVNGSL